MKFIFFCFTVILCLSGFSQQPDCRQSKWIAANESSRFSKKNNALKQASVASDNFSVHYYRCEWKINPAVRYIDGKVTAHFIMHADGGALTFDFTKQLLIDSILFRKNKIAFSQNNNESLTIQTGQTLTAGMQDSVTIYYHGIPANSSFGSFIKEEHAGVPVIWTLSEPYGAKDWWPCRNGLDDKADSIDIHIITPSQYVASSNGVLIAEAENNGWKTFSYRHRYPIATYLVAFAVTNYAVMQSSVQVGNTTMPFINYVYPENLTEWQQTADKVKQAMQQLNDWLGPYPFYKEKYAQTQFSWGGGMEHQANSFIVNTDAYLMAHELVHQWFGDKVTIGSWQDLWLNEGFAVYYGDLVFKTTDPVLYKALLQSQHASVINEPGGSVWVDDTLDVNRLFNGRLTYDKGGYLLRMLHLTLGDSAFNKAIYYYVNDPALAYRFARTKNLQQHLEAVHGRSLQYFFDQWFTGQGHPSFTVNWFQNKNKWARLTVHQTTSHPSVNLFKMPLPVTFKKGNQTVKKIIFIDEQDDEIWVDVGFEADEMIIDEDLEVLSSNNTATKTIYTETGENEINIYPNPVKEYLQLQLINPAFSSIKISIYNSAGQLVYSSVYNVSGFDENIRIAFQGFAKGIYHLIAETNNQILVRKTIIK